RMDVSRAQLTPPPRADRGGDPADQLGHQPLKPGLNVDQRQIRTDQPHAAIDVVPDAAGLDDTFAHIERRHTTDGKSVAPVAIRHAEGGPLDSWKTGYIGDLIEHAAVHGLQHGGCRVDPRWDKHPGFLRRRDFPYLVSDSIHSHARVQFQLITYHRR